MSERDDLSDFVPLGYAWDGKFYLFKDGEFFVLREEEE